jgi:YegS/Rv2252/BmrU family lipid kinase
LQLDNKKLPAAPIAGTPPARSGWLAIVNPASGRHRSRKGWPAIERALRAASVDIETAETRYAGDGEDIARRAIGEGRRRLLAVGGDGSVNEVLNGIMTAGLADPGEVTLAVAPTGTGNDWARSLGIGRAPEDIASVVAAARTMMHDVGAADFPGVAGARRRWFINVAGAGYDAYVTARVPRPPTAFTYLKGALSGLATYRSPLFRITADEATFEDRLLLAFVANAQYCGNRMHVAPTARLDDGLLDLLTVRELGLGAVLTKLAKLYGGTILGDPAVRHFRAARIRIDADPPAQVQGDGQMLGQTPVEFTVLRQTLRVVKGHAG